MDVDQAVEALMQQYLNTNDPREMVIIMQKIEKLKGLAST